MNISILKNQNDKINVYDDKSIKNLYISLLHQSIM